MKAIDFRFTALIHAGILATLLLATASASFSQLAVTNDPPLYGPFNAVFLPDGDGLRKPLLRDDSILRPDSPWSLYAWVKPAETKNATLIAGVGDPAEEFPRYLALDGGHLTLWIGKDNSLHSSQSVTADQWHFVGATFNGEEFALYADGAQVSRGQLDLGSASPVLGLAPTALPNSQWRHFGGSIASFTLLRHALTSEEIKQLEHEVP